MNEIENILEFLNALLVDSDCYLVSYKAKPNNNYQIFLDSDSGFTLEKSIKMNRSLRKQIEESGMFPEGNFALEISSPGIDTPLKLPRQYTKNIGRKLSIELNDEDNTIINGKLTQTDDIGITISQFHKKTKTIPEHTTTKKILFTDIKKATVLIDFQ